MKLIELLKMTNWEAIEMKAFKLGYKKDELNKLKKTWEELLITKFKENKNLMLIKMDVAGYDLGVHENIYIYGLEKGNEIDDIDLSFYKKNEWLGFVISKKTLFMLSKEEILLFCMREMSLWDIERENNLEKIG